jgi:hypothetical protein
MKSKLFIFSLALLVIDVQPSRADEPPAIPYRCEESIVTEKGYYFENNPQSGVYTDFNSKLGVETFKNQSARVVDRNARLNSVMDLQKVGDKVQVCLISLPDAGDCDLKKDPRGRIYRVYNYRLKSAYSGFNANHSCGGA